MTTRLLQIDFPYDGPWGEALASACDPLAHDIAGESGLRWKIWTENREHGRAGGIYLFDDEAACTRYLEKHRARLAGFGIVDIRAEVFEVNGPLSAITRAPL